MSITVLIVSQWPPHLSAFHGSTKQEEMAHVLQGYQEAYLH